MSAPPQYPQQGYGYPPQQPNTQPQYPQQPYSHGYPQPGPPTIQYHPVTVVNYDTTNHNSYPHYQAKPASVLGWMQVIIGCVLIVMQIVLFAIKDTSSYGSSGFWASVFFIIAGGFGIQSAKTKSKCSVITTMVMSIIAAVVSVSVITQSSIGIAMASNNCNYYYDYSYSNNFICKTDRAGVGINVVVLLLGLTEGVAAIVASAYCCAGCCCGGGGPGAVLQPNQVQYVNQYPQVISGGVAGQGAYGPPQAGMPMASAPPPYGTAPPQYTEKGLY